jgi:alpha-tubulin suppressor-like RCC1 family protein
LYHSGVSVFPEGAGGIKKIDLSPLDHVILRDIFVGFTHAYMITVNNEIIVSGENKKGQLGVPSCSFLSPAKLNNDMRFSAPIKVASGWYHAVIYSRKCTYIDH